MVDVYSTEEQQLEAIKRWWKQYGNMITWTIFLVALMVAGWRYWQHHQQVTAENASMQYDAMMLGLKNDDKTTAIHKGEVLIQDYAKTPYASLAALALAKQAVEDKALDQARAHLQWIIDQGHSTEFQLIARVRLARLLIDEKDYSAAMALLDVKDANGYVTLIEELKVNIYLSEGKIEDAKKAYVKAWKSVPDSLQNNRMILRMKLEALGEGAVIRNGELT